MQSAEEKQLEDITRAMTPITLADMKSIRLMKRTDTKFVTNVPTLLRLLSLVRDTYYIQEVDGARVSRYRTVYWDDPAQHAFFSVHVHGHLPRTKVRVRTYVESDLTFLEIKRKNNHGKTSKTRTRVTDIPSVMEGAEGEPFLEEKTGLTFSNIKPAVGNHFRRITLVNRGKTERLTIDFDLEFDNFETGCTYDLSNVVVVELKRDGRVFSPILAKLRELRIKPSGFSKYCIGTALTNDALPHNLLKERLRYVKRIASVTA